MICQHRAVAPAGVATAVSIMLDERNAYVGVPLVEAGDGFWLLQMLVWLQCNRHHDASQQPDDEAGTREKTMAMILEEGP